MKTRAILFPQPETAQVLDVQLREPEGDEVLIKTSFSCIHPETERPQLVAHSVAPSAFPMIPGSALTGIVVSVGESASIAPGTRVFCTGTGQVEDYACLQGGHIGYALRKSEEVFPLPTGLSLREAALVGLVGQAYRGTRLSRPLRGETVVILGLGPTGILSARLHAAQGVRVIGADLAPERAELAQRAGLETVSGDTIFTQLQELLPEGADLVVDTTGSSAVLDQALVLAQELAPEPREPRGTRFLLQGSYPTLLTIPSKSAGEKDARFILPASAQASDIRQAIALLAQKNVVVQDLITLTIPPEEAPRAYGALLRNPPELQTIVFEWLRL